MSIILLLGTLTGILLAVGWLIAGPLGTLAALIIAIVINIGTYMYSDRLVLKMYRAEPFENEKVQRMLSYLADEAKIPTPRLFIIKSPILNAFATGRSPRNAVVAVTEGLLALEEDELQGVLAHEIAHIKNRDMLVSALAATIAGAIAYVAHIGYFSLFFGNSQEKSPLSLIFIIIFAPLAAFLVRLAVSRSREFGADWTGALLTKKPEALASALRKISTTAREHPIQGSVATSHLWIVNPFKQDWFTSLFSTHPPLEKRIERLEIIRSSGEYVA
ncbi:MAG: M48 family metalloprotease [Candidatus Aenigmarchaeota archaeon]|nr:M48 family metalloprotease [Candidatus Aenigmarchaeota archaeon]